MAFLIYNLAFHVFISILSFNSIRLPSSSTTLHFIFPFSYFSFNLSHIQLGCLPHLQPCCHLAPLPRFKHGRLSSASPSVDGFLLRGNCRQFRRRNRLSSRSRWDNLCSSWIFNQSRNFLNWICSRASTSHKLCLHLQAILAQVFLSPKMFNIFSPLLKWLWIFIGIFLA